MKVPVLTATEWARSGLAQRRQAPAAVDVTRVEAILAAVRDEGDRALLRLTRELDGVELDRIELDRAPWEAGAAAVTATEARALESAAARIEAFHSLQRPAPLRLGEELELRPEPLRRVGIYVPGGRARYPSTVLMNAIPARLAGVGEVLMTTPPGRDGAIAPAVLYAARLAGVSRVFRVGGAQAIGALAYGTESIPAVDKITGPGNVFVALAKRAVYGVVGIDGLAGPSEILVVADDSADPAQVVADLASQLEHDPAAWAVLVTDSQELAAEVARALGADELASRFTAEAGDDLHAAVVLVDSIAGALDLAAEFAPEHLELLVRDPGAWLPRVRRAGMVFAGPYSPVPIGDYVAGSNHTLPTGGAARFSSPLGVYDFYRWTSVVRLGPQTAGEIAPVGIEMARMEGLRAHQRALELLLARIGAGS